MIKDDTEILVVCNTTMAEHLLSNDTTGRLSNALVITSVVEDKKAIVIPKDEFLYYLEYGYSDFKE